MPCEIHCCVGRFEPFDREKDRIQDGRLYRMKSGYEAILQSSDEYHDLFLGPELPNGETPKWDADGKAGTVAWELGDVVAVERKALGIW